MVRSTCLLLLLSLLRCVAPETLPICEETSIQTTYGGYVYRTLLNAQLANTDQSGAKFEEKEAQWPTGWLIVPSDSDIAANVIAAHSWQCRRLVTQFAAYATGLHEAPGSVTDAATQLWEARDATYLSVVDQPEGNHLYRLLLRRSCATTTITSTATTSTSTTSTVPPLLLLSPCGASGRLGPIQTQCDTAYGSENVVLVSSGYQEWSVPVTSEYSIEARGAQGGSHGATPGGFGALAFGVFALTAGDKLLMVVGHAGHSSAIGGSGGGGTFVAKIVDSGGDAVSSLSDVRVELLVAAGGGAGMLNSLRSAPGGRGIVDSVSAGPAQAGGGGGFRSDAAGGCSGTVCGAVSFLSGSIGGAGPTEQGGFGGGGHPVDGAPGGGGGGYEGGFCEAEACLGGTSFGATAIAAINEGDGSVTITPITTTTTTSSTETRTSITSTVSTSTSVTATTSTGTATTSTNTTTSTSTTTSMTTTSTSTATTTTTTTASSTTSKTHTVSTSTTNTRTTASSTTSSTTTGTSTDTSVTTSATSNTNTGSSITTSVTTFTTTGSSTTATNTSSTSTASMTTTTRTGSSTTTASTTSTVSATSSTTVTTSSSTVTSSTSFTTTNSTSTISVTSITTSTTETSTTASGTAGEMQLDQAIADMHDAVSEVAQSLLAATSHTASPSQMVSQTIMQGGAMITVVVATVNAAAAKGGSASISVAPAADGEFARSIKVPQAVLEQALTHAGASSGPVALAASSLDGGFTAAMQHTTGKNLQVVGHPLSITILTADGTLLSGVQLAEPIEFTLLEQAPSDAQCAYWDETRGTWSSEGVERIHAPRESGQLVCATYHLTIFAAVLGLIADIADILECSTAETIFSLEGLETLMHGGDWWKAAPTIMVWVWMAVFVAIFAFARRQDLGHPQAFPWELDKQELPANEFEDEEESHANEKAQSEPEGEPAEATGSRRSNTIRQSLGEVGGRTGLQVACDCCAAILNLPNAFTIFVFELPEAPKKVVTNCVHRVHAYKSGIDEDSLHTVKQVVFSGGQEQFNVVPNASTPPRTSLRSGESSSSLHSNFHRAASGLAEAQEVHKKGRTAVDSFLRASCPRRAFVLFPAVHPWVHIFSYSMFVPHTARVAMLMMKIFGSVAVSALFLSSAGGMLSPDSPIECAPDHLRGQLVEAVFVGMVSAMFSDGIVAFLFALRRETIAVELDQAALARQRALWKLRMRIFWIVAVCHLCLSIYVVVVFLANVSSSNIDEWGLTAVFTLVQDFLVMPLLVAFLLSSLASLVMWCRPSVRDSAVQSTLLQSKVVTRVPHSPQVKAGVKSIDEAPASHGSEYQSGGDASTEVEPPSVSRQRSGTRQQSWTSKVSSHESTSFEARRHKIMDSL